MTPFSIARIYDMKEDQPMEKLKHTSFTGFKVGDRVIIAHAEKNDPSLRPNAIGIITHKDDSTIYECPYEVEFPDGEGCLYKAEELDFAPVPDAPKKANTCTITLLGSKGQQYEALFVDVGSETFRSYMFPEMVSAEGVRRLPNIVRIDNPKWLYVAPSGSHRILDKNGRSHYIPSGWTHLWWLPEKK